MKPAIKIMKAIPHIIIEPLNDESETIIHIAEKSGCEELFNAIRECANCIFGDTKAQFMTDAKSALEATKHSDWLALLSDNSQLLPVI